MKSRPLHEIQAEYKAMRAAAAPQPVKTPPKQAAKLSDAEAYARAKAMTPPSSTPRTVTYQSNWMTWDAQ